ncbi:KRUF family protein, partial [Toxoplasma gondii TgCatPRC2]
LSGTAWWFVTSVARGRGRRKREPRDEGAASAVPPELLESSVPQVEAQMSSLRGTFFGSNIDVPGHEATTYVQLAIDKMRQEADAWEKKYRSAAAFVQDNLACRMLQENNRNPPPDTTRRWMTLAARRFSYRGCVSLQEAADLRRAADNLEKEAAAAGVLIRTSQEPTAPPSESAGPSQAAQAEGMAGAEQSSPGVSGKRKEKRKHLAPSSSEQPGEGSSSGGGLRVPRSLWLTPVAAFRLDAPSSGDGGEVASSRRLEPSTTQKAQKKRDCRSQQVTASSSTTVKRAPQASGEQVPARREPVRSSTLHRSPAPSET